MFFLVMFFTENLLGHLLIPCPLVCPSIPASLSPTDCPSRDHVRTHASRDFNEVICLKDFHQVECERKKLQVFHDGVDGGAHTVLAAVGVQINVDAAHDASPSGGAACDTVADSLLFPISSSSDLI